MPSLASPFVKYYTYEGGLSVSGSVGPVLTNGVTQTFSYSLADVDPLCSGGPGDAANSCGVHIHSGRTCDDDAGGHYFTGIVTDDPWTTIAYTADAGTMASGIVEVTTGALGADVDGRAVVIHGFDGGRIACALLQAAPVLSSSATVLDELGALAERRDAGSLDFLVLYFRFAGVGLPGLATALLVAIGTVLLIPWVLMSVGFGWLWTSAYGGLVGIPSATFAVWVGHVLGSSIAYGLGTLLTHLDSVERIQAAKQWMRPSSESFVLRAHAEMSETPRQFLILLRIFPLTPINLLNYYVSASPLFSFYDHLCSLPITALLSFMWVGVGGATVKVRQHDQGSAPDRHLAYAWAGIGVVLTLCIFFLALVLWLLCRAAKRNAVDASAGAQPQKDLEVGGGSAGAGLFITHQQPRPSADTGLVPPPKRFSLPLAQEQVDATLTLPPPPQELMLNQASIIADSVLPLGWREVHEGDDCYYYNDETGESQWEQPTVSEQALGMQQERPLPISSKLSDDI